MERTLLASRHGEIVAAHDSLSLPALITRQAGCHRGPTHNDHSSRLSEFRPYLESKAHHDPHPFAFTTPEPFSPQMHLALRSRLREEEEKKSAFLPGRLSLKFGLHAKHRDLNP